MVPAEQEPMRVPLTVWNESVVIFEARPNIARLQSAVLGFGLVPPLLILAGVISKEEVTVGLGLLLQVAYLLPLSMWIVGRRSCYQVCFDRLMQTVTLTQVAGVESAKTWSAGWNEIARLKDCPGGLQIEWQDGTPGPVLLLQQDAPIAFREILDLGNPKR